MNNTDYTLRRGNGDPAGLRIARGLGWFSIALGALEIFATRKLIRALGMRGNEGLIQLYGLREIATGIGILTAKDATPWIWGRVVGDALDTGTLAAHLNDENPKEANVALALGSVAMATAADIYCATKLGCNSVSAIGDAGRYDYSSRSGLPQHSETSGDLGPTHAGSGAVPQDA